MTSSQGGSKGFQQVDDHVKAEYQRDVNGFVGNGPGSQAGDEPITSKIGVNGQNERQVAGQGNAAVQVPQQQPQGSLVHWEQFLHVRSIKVMLVENDDCTRHIVTALLRNCNYEVIEAANGLQAWKILENLSIHIDIVLTEVVMPFLSGIGLLYKIMSHKSRKNVPVIMMSSHDSMGLVFKCLSKGAVDFLVKPIRKNELKILWQHIWRRCHSSSGSGSESGTQAQKSVNSKSNLRCNNGRIDGDDDGSTDGSSDDGSGTQSSWTKQGVEPESPEAASPCDQDSTCGLVIRPRRDFNDQEGQPCLDDGANAKETAIQISKNSEMQIEFPIEAPIKHNGTKQNIHQVLDHTLNVKTKDSKKHKAKDSKMSDPHMENVEIKGQEEPEKIINANTKVIADFNEVVVGETGLKRPRATENDERKLQNGCNILRHSELSAFTRYNTNSNVVKCTPGIAGSCSQPDNRTSLLKNESNHDAHSDGYLIYQGSSEQVIPRKADGTTPADALNQELHIQHIHHHHHVHHYHNIATDQQLLSKHDDFGLSKLAADAPYCGSSNIKGGGAIEGNLENNSINRSGSGSKHGSNVPNGSNTGVNLEVTNVESNVGVAGISGSGDASGGGSRDHHKSAQREAALTKFRQKREARCFQKKVRYQNRKKLAEQRTRVRGQFVKGTNRDCSTTADDG